MTPAQELLAQAYADGENAGRDAAARESAAEIEGLRADLKEAREQVNALANELGWTIAATRAATAAAQERLARWDAVAQELRQLLARNQTIQFLPSPGPARLLLGHLGLQGLGMDGLLRALATVAEECKP